MQNKLPKQASCQGNGSSNALGQRIEQTKWIPNAPFLPKLKQIPNMRWCLDERQQACLSREPHLNKQKQASRLCKSFPQVDIKHSDNLFACFCPRASAIHGIQKQSLGTVLCAHYDANQQTRFRCTAIPFAKGASITDTFEITRNPPNPPKMTSAKCFCCI